jgi:hypothetical protein
MGVDTFEFVIAFSLVCSLEVVFLPGSHLWLKHCYNDHYSSLGMRLIDVWMVCRYNLMLGNVCTS